MLALAEESGGIPVRTNLEYFTDNLRAGTARQFREFRKGLGSGFRSRSSAPFEASENGAFGRLGQRNRGDQPSA